MTATTTACTPEQQTEWAALIDRLAEIRKDIERAESMVTHYMLKHVDPAERYPLHMYELAKDEALDVVRLRAGLEAVQAEYAAHPYTLEVQARKTQGAGA